MKRRPWRDSSPIIPILCFVVGLLLIYAPFKAGLLTFSKIESRKDLIDAVSTILGTIGLLIGGALAYVRFFKGRLLKPKIDLEIQSGCFTNQSKNTHWIEIAIINKGSVALWNYRVFLYAQKHPSQVPGERTNFSECIIAHKHTENLVNIGETAFEHAVIEVDRYHPFAYTFEIILCDNSKTVWRRCLTVRNAG